MSEQYEMVNHPSHYQMYEEVVEMINKVAGPFIASMWCKWNGFKYRMRMGTKPNNPIEQEIKKEKVYLDLYEKYREQWFKEGVDFNSLTNDEKFYIKYVYMTQKDKIEDFIKRTSVNDYDLVGENGEEGIYHNCSDNRMILKG